MTKLNGKTPDLAAENIEQLRQIFPDVFEEGKIDFDKLKQVLGEYVDDEKERYNFTWNGKGKALRLAQTPTTGTLRPCKAESKNWDDTQNLYIEGDNLEVLKLLQKSYHGKIKMIYIDPPYNTGGDFVYPDDFSDNIKNYKQITGQVDDEGMRLGTNSEFNGRYHTDWLNMMYPRLRLARNLLKEDGIIFISINDNEQGNLKKVCDEVFGESNFVAQLIWQQRKGGGNDSRFIATDHEYILIYCKSIDNITEPWRIAQSEEYRKRYRETDETGKFYWDTLVRNGLKNPIVITITTPDGNQITINSQKSKETVLSGLKDGTIKFTKTNSGWSLHHKVYMKEGQVLRSLLTEYGNNKSAVDELTDIFGTPPFDYSKPHTLISLLLSLDSSKDGIVLDFFSGSATTAHAVMQLNAEDSSKRRFIMVQLPEPCADSTEAAKAGYKNICEIGKERIRRAGEKIKAEIEEQNAQLKIGEEPKKVPDIGFKVFKLDSSNLKRWQPDYDDLETTLFDSISNYVDGRSELDVVYEIMLKMGMELTWPLETHTIGGKNVYEIGMGALMICLDDHITTEVAEGMVALHKELSPETWRVVFKDNGFADDSAKVNIKEILKSAGLEEDAFTTV